MTSDLPTSLLCAAAAALFLTGAVLAAEGDTGVAPAAVAAPPPEAASPAVPPPKRPDFEGAVGLVFNHSPTYSGAKDNKTSVIPGLFLRWGRVSLSTNGGFVSRSNDDIERGLNTTLVRSDTVRLGVTLRFDNGRQDSSDPALVGVHEVRRTLRARLGARWTPAPGWQLGSALSVDALGRGGGALVDVGISREWPLMPRVSWSLGGGLAWGDARYMRTHFGITPEDTLTSTYALYQPGSGLRDVSLSARIRFELGPRWIGYAGVATSRTLGPARDSPLTSGSSGKLFNAGLAWRF